MSSLANLLASAGSSLFHVHDITEYDFHLNLLQAGRLPLHHVDASVSGQI